MLGVSPSYLLGHGPVAILVNVVAAAVAALTLVIDFGFVEEGARSGAPKYMEWFAAFGLMVSLVWLYVEILDLLSRADERAN